ncbi:MAG: peptide chain release factor N(5)-glutamine methyltransferase [Clostridia bacterium]|nr:peptide chain release factor N(5)-glutamine methyltransferase [Clostridia bacterium]
MTLRELERALRDAGIENWRAEAAYLAEHFCGVPYERSVFAKDEELSGDGLEAALERRIAREPRLYILGEWKFMNETYKVDRSVLIPRQDTEVLVEWAIANVPRGGRVADLCTGSGCVAVSTLAARADLECVAVDKYADVLEIARQNAVLNGVFDRIAFEACDVLEGLPDGSFDAILCNPPYVTDSEYEDLAPEIFYEPRRALCGGTDGLDFYRSILSRCGAILKDTGAAAFEIGSSQAGAVSSIAAAHGFDAEIVKDLSGNDRVAVCKKRK